MVLFPEIFLILSLCPTVQPKPHQEIHLWDVDFSFNNKNCALPRFLRRKKSPTYLPRKVESYKQLKCRECSQHDQSQEAMSTWMRFWDWINGQFYVDLYIFVWCLVGLWEKVLSSVICPGRSGRSGRFGPFRVGFFLSAGLLRSVYALSETSVPGWSNPKKQTMPGKY